MDQAGLRDVPAYASKCNHTQNTVFLFLEDEFILLRCVYVPGGTRRGVRSLEDGVAGNSGRRA